MAFEKIRAGEAFVEANPGFRVQKHSMPVPALPFVPLFSDQPNGMWDEFERRLDLSSDDKPEWTAWDTSPAHAKRLGISAKTFKKRFGSQYIGEQETSDGMKHPRYRLRIDLLSEDDRKSF